MMDIIFGIVDGILFETNELINFFFGDVDFVLESLGDFLQIVFLFFQCLDFLKQLLLFFRKL